MNCEHLQKFFLEKEGIFRFLMYSSIIYKKHKCFLLNKMTSFKYKLYPCDHSNIDRQINVACFIYNHCIALKKRYYKRFKKSLSISKLKAHIAKIKHRGRFGFFKEINSQTTQDIIERIEKGYQAFFKKQNKHTPDFKGKKRYNSITFKQTGYKYLGENKI